MFSHHILCTYQPTSGGVSLQNRKMSPGSLVGRQGEDPGAQKNLENGYKTVSLGERRTGIEAKQAKPVES